MDANLVSTIIQLVFSIFIFLLGVPALVFQLFIPDDLRKIYNNHRGFRDISLLAIFFVLTLILLVYYSANFIPYFDSYWEWLEEIPFNRSVIISVSIFIFLVLSIAVYKTYSKEKIHETLVLKIIHKCKKQLDNKENIKKEHINDLSTLGKVLKSGLQTEFLIRGIGELVDIILKNNDYNGNNIKEQLIADVLCESICYHSDSGSRENYLEAIKIYERIAQRQKEGMAMIDARAVKNCALMMGQYALDKNWSEVAIRVKDLLKKLPDSKPYVYKFCKLAFEKGEYIIVTSVIRKSIDKLLKEDNITRRYNLLAFLSWFYFENNEMKRYALSMFTFFKEKCKPTTSLSDFEAARSHFYNVNDFDAAYKIKLFAEELFTPIVKQNSSRNSLSHLRNQIRRNRTKYRIGRR